MQTPENTTSDDLKLIVQAVLNIRIWLMFEGPPDDMDPEIVEAIQILHNATTARPDVAARLREISAEMNERRR